MKVKKITKTRKKVICAILIAAMVFTNAGIAVYAEERVSVEESVTVEDGAETEESMIAEESVEREESMIAEESVETEECVTAEKTEDAERSGDDLDEKEETEVSKEELKSDSESGDIAGGVINYLDPDENGQQVVRLAGGLIQMETFM